MDVNLVKVNKGELLTLDNPNYDAVIARYPHLKGVRLRDRDTKPRLPVHIILGEGEYARIKTETPPHIGEDGDDAYANQPVGVRRTLQAWRVRTSQKYSLRPTSSV